MVQQQRYDAGAIQPVWLLVALRNKLTGRNVKIRFAIKAEGSGSYETNQFGNWNLNQHLQSLQSQQSESAEMQFYFKPKNWDEAWDGDDPSFWGESVPENQILEEMYRPATLIVNMHNNSPQSVSISNSGNLVILNPNLESRPDQISENVWNAALNSIRDAGEPRILIFLQPIWIKARKFSNRLGTIQSPTLIVVHHTGGELISSAIYHFTRENASSSIHYIIDKDGQIVKMVMNSKCAWHADGKGGSHWGGSQRVNHFSIGIEIVHADGPDGNNPFTEEQYNALISLIQSLQERHNIPQHRVVGHSDVAVPPSHNCPGPNFDWRTLENAGLGLKVPFYESNLNPYDFPIERKSPSQLIEELKEDLRGIGYYLPEESGYGSETATAIERFKRHFLSGSRRPRDENGEMTRWRNVINGDNVDLQVAEMIKAARKYINEQ